MKKYFTLSRTINLFNRHDLLAKIIAQFQGGIRPTLKRMENQYDGKHKIVYRKATDENKPCNKAVVNYCRTIVDNYNGYLLGKPITYSSDMDITQLIDVLNYNDEQTENNQLLKDALTYGVGYELSYLDEEAKIRFRTLSPLETIPVYDDTLNQDLLYVIRFYRTGLVYNTEEADNRYFVEIYSNEGFAVYESNSSYSSFELISSEQNHFNQLPITVFSLNEDEEAIFNQIISLNDSYNSLLSDQLDTADYFSDEYLVISGAYGTDEELADMKSKRILLLDTDSDAHFLSKNVADAQMEQTLKNLEDKIYRISNCCNFNDEAFGNASSGVSLRYKMIGMENTSAAIESNMKKALQKRIELINSILQLKGESDEPWRDIQIIFTRNLPIDEQAQATLINQYRGLVSDKTLLSQIPFVKDVDQELKQLDEQKQANIDMYGGFGNNNTEEDDE